MFLASIPLSILSCAKYYSLLCRWDPPLQLQEEVWKHPLLDLFGGVPYIYICIYIHIRIHTVCLKWFLFARVSNVFYLLHTVVLAGLAAAWFPASPAPVIDTNPLHRREMIVYIQVQFPHLLLGMQNRKMVISEMRWNLAKWNNISPGFPWNKGSPFPLLNHNLTRRNEPPFLASSSTFLLLSFVDLLGEAFAPFWRFFHVFHKTPCRENPRKHRWLIEGPIQAGIFQNPSIV